MCFSAGASFSASAVIGIIGIISVKKSTTTPQRVLAGIPVFFATQQAIEGALWLSLTRPEFHYLTNFSTFSFLFLALVIWPVMVPLTVLLMERRKLRRNILTLLLCSGIFVALFHLYGLLAYTPTAAVEQHHIRYELNFSESMLYISSIIYFIPALIPPFISSTRLIFLGILLVLSYAFTWLFYHHYIISVWCFFATIISLVALQTIWNLNREKQKAGSDYPGP